MPDPREEAELRDDQTVILLQRTSWLGPRDVLRDCAACGRPFWVHPTATLSRYCDERCCSRAYYHAHPVYRARTIARVAERYQRSRREAT
jgi:hypothetical protein